MPAPRSPAATRPRRALDHASCRHGPATTTECGRRACQTPWLEASRSLESFRQCGSRLVVEWATPLSPRLPVQRVPSALRGSTPARLQDRGGPRNPVNRSDAMASVRSTVALPRHGRPTACRQTRKWGPVQASRTCLSNRHRFLSIEVWVAVRIRASASRPRLARGCDHNRSRRRARVSGHRAENREGSSTCSCSGLVPSAVHRSLPPWRSNRSSLRLRVKPSRHRFDRTGSAPGRSMRTIGSRTWTQPQDGRAPRR